MAIGISSFYYYENDIENDCIWLIQMGVEQLIQINFIAFQTMLQSETSYHDCM